MTLDRLWAGWRSEYIESVSAEKRDARSSVFTLILESGLPDDETHIVLVDERTQRRHVALVVHTRDERVAVGTVERGSERVHVDGDGRRPGATERSHDVDALTRAGE